MRRRTWDILAKFVSENMGIKVVICDCPGPRIFLETKTIELPERIKHENALSALASVFHEAAHMKYTVEIPKDFSKTNLDHNILNAIEDARIDQKNFNLLPNVKEFYRKHLLQHVLTDENKAEIMKQDSLVRCMIHLIINHTFPEHRWDQDAEQVVCQHGLNGLFSEGIWAIEGKNWTKLRKIIDEIKSKFNMEEKPEQQQGDKDGEKGDGNDSDQSPGSGIGDSDSVSDGSRPPEGSEGHSKSGDKNKEAKKGSKKPGENDIEKLLHPGSVWGKGDGLRGPGGQEFNQAELSATTRNKFVDVLNIKERYTVDDGKALDTDNLIAFFTGQMEELFRETKEEKVKRSKIVFCLDASGSMNDRMMDGNGRRKVLTSTVQSLVNILDDVRETEGLNVDYDIIAFAGSPHLLSKNNWRYEYSRITGGTRVLRAMEMAVQILSDDTIDGNRIVILITDGEVYSSEIEDMKKLIAGKHGEIKAMFIGMEADGFFVNEVCGEDNILCLEHADQILMEAIQTMLEGS